MTKKHFEAFARAIADGTLGGPLDRPWTREEREAQAALVVLIAEQNNPRFDRARFMKACGLSE